METVSTAKVLVYQVYGIALSSDYSFANRLIKTDRNPDLSFICSNKAPAKSWRRSRPAYVSSLLTDNGRCTFSYYEEKDYDVMHFSDIADFYIWPKRIICHILKKKYEYLVEILLLGMVLSLWLEKNGVPVLHTAAVMTDKGVVAFLGSNGQGKSSLAGSMIQAGCRLITDDILAVERNNGTFFGQPGYPQLRLWPKGAEHFLGQYKKLTKVNPLYSKRNVPVDSEFGLGSFCEVSKPLACFYLLDRNDSSDECIRTKIERVSPANAVIEMVRNSFLADLVDGLGIQPQRLGFFAKMAEKIPMRRIVYTSNLGYLSDVKQAILEDINQMDVNHKSIKLCS